MARTSFVRAIPLVLIGALAGASLAVNVVGLLDEPRYLISAIVAGAVLGVGLLFALRLGLRRAVRGTLLAPEIKAAYRCRDTYTYAPFLLLLLLGAGVQISIPVAFIVLLSFGTAQAVLLFVEYKKTLAGANFFHSLGWLTFLFLVSGVAALIYEIVWQRVLFSSYGVNIESVTIIVSLFMFGLGVGSLLGGLLSERFPEHLPLLFVACEASIGLFGLVSIPLIQFVASRTLDLSLTGVTLAVYGLLCVPTMFMGATLPILVTYLHRHFRHIGRSVGILYFFNTIGSAAACVLTVDLLFVFVGRQAAASLAALLNFLVAGCVLAYAQRLQHSHDEA